MDFFRGLFQDSPTKRLTAAEALRHLYLQDCFQEMQQARQGNPRCSHSKHATKPQKGGVSKLKTFFGSRKHHPDKYQQPTPQELELYFPPFEMSHNK